MLKLSNWIADEEAFMAKLSAFWDVLLVAVVIAFVSVNQDLEYDANLKSILLFCATLSVFYVLYRMIRRFARLLDEPYFDFEGRPQHKKQSWFLNYLINPLFFFCAFLILIGLFKVNIQFMDKLEAGFAFAGLVVSTRTVILAGFVFLIILTATRFVQRVTLEKLQEHVEMGITFKNSLIAGMGYFGAVLAFCGLFAALGANVLPFVLLLAAIFIGMCFGLKDMIQNFVSGMQILWTRSIKIGDWIIVGSAEGFVKRITLCSTEIETLDKASVIFPNTDITTKKVINWTHEDTIGRTEVKVSVPYGVKMEKVRAIMLAIADNHPSVLDDPAPSVVVLDIRKDSVDVELRCFIPNKVQRFSIANTLREEIYEALIKAKIKA